MPNITFKLCASYTLLTVVTLSFATRRKLLERFVYHSLDIL